MGRIGPPDLVHVGIPLRIGLGRRYQPAPVILVNRHLLGEQEPRAQPRGEDRGDSAGVTGPADRNDRYRRDGVHNSGHERQGRDAAPDVPAGFPALGDDDVDSAGDCLPCFLGAADRVQNDSPGGAQPGFETAAASRGTAAIGAWTMGRSMSSNSHTGVRTAIVP
jgi:hypothetical protein